MALMDRDSAGIRHQASGIRREGLESLVDCRQERFGHVTFGALCLVGLAQGGALALSSLKPVA
jgi:hypothetical protein